ncbi:MAG TPA: hypothetical protein VN963_08220 [bacterium]|nr:hypothetical protein [bacterium]
MRKTIKKQKSRNGSGKKKDKLSDVVYVMLPEEESGRNLLRPLKGKRRKSK